MIAWGSNTLMHPCRSNVWGGGSEPLDPCDVDVYERRYANRSTQSFENAHPRKFEVHEYAKFRPLPIYRDDDRLIVHGSLSFKVSCRV